MISRFIAFLLIFLFTQNLSAQQCTIDSPFNHIQVKGSHNSYHQKPFIPLSPGWNYSHPPLKEQFSNYKIRQVELDINWNQAQGTIDVFHIPIIDTRTSCKNISSCFEQMAFWSKKHQNHEPIMVLLEIKNNITEMPKADEYLNLLEENIKNHFPQDSLYTPDDLKGNFSSVKEALLNLGWPSYRSMQGKFIFVLHTKGLLRDAYTQQHTNLDGRLMFAESDGQSPYSAIIIENDPVRKFEKIKSLVKMGFIVRTRADSGLSYSQDRIEKAIQSGSQFITTDFLKPSDRGFFDLSGENTFRCNFLAQGNLHLARDEN